MNFKSHSSALCGGYTDTEKPRHVAIWVDYQEAILIRYLGDLFGGRGKYSRMAPLVCDGGWAEHRIGTRPGMHANHVYDEIIQHLRCTDRILILGPGAAKHRLHQKITDLQGRRGKVVEVRNAHEMTERELVRQAEDRMVAPNLTLIVVGGAIVGAATGMFFTSNSAMGTAIVPNEKAGRYLGLSNLAGAAAGAVGAYIGGPIADYFSVRMPAIPGIGYVVLFGIFGVLFLLSALVLVAIRQPQEAAA